MKGGFPDRIRLERRESLLTTEDALEWDEGDQVEWDEGDPVDASDGDIGDGYGNTQGGWARIGPPQLGAQISEIGGNESVDAAKLQGVGQCLVLVRSSRFTRSITTDDRLVEVGGAGRTFNIRRVPPAGRALFITLTCEWNVAT